MAGIGKGMSLLFKGPPDAPDNSEAEAKQKQEIEAGRQGQQAALNKQQETLQNQEAEQDAAVEGATRVPRGRRLLLAATGERGVQKTLA